MNLTPYQANYFAYELTRRFPSDSVAKLAGALVDAQVDLTAALTLEDKLAGQKQVKAIEAQRNTKRRALFDTHDEIDAQREHLIAEIEGKFQQRTSLAELFAVRWFLT